MKKILANLVIVGTIASVLLTGCVNQHPQEVEAKQKREGTRIIATSVAASQVADSLGLDLVGIAKSMIFTVPERYKDVVQVGMPMNPDMEAIKELEPTDILSPKTLEPDLKPRYEQVGVPYTFLDLSSVEGLYRSVEMLGEKYGRQKESAALVEEYHAKLKELEEKQEGKVHPKVLILMGLPGSYVIATNKSYVGNLIEMAGGDNLYRDDVEEFLTVNTEDLVTRDPDMIFCTVHAMPEEVIEQFKEEFAGNDIWKHFRAVKTGRVYYLDHELFHMSANFRWKEAVESVEDYISETGAN